MSSQAPKTQAKRFFCGRASRFSGDFYYFSIDIALLPLVMMCDQQDIFCIYAHFGTAFLAATALTMTRALAPFKKNVG